MRTLGSFNERVNLPRHHDDHKPVAPDRPAVKTLQTGGYTLGIARNAPPNEGYAADWWKLRTKQENPWSAANGWTSS
jgi:hypothetical protein